MKFHYGTRSMPTTLPRELAVGNRSSLLQESVLDWARVLGKVATGRSLLQEDFEN